MKITADAKEQVRKRIIDAARNLFFRNGFENTTTRDVASDSRIATGTLFNYFATKESLAMTMIAEALEGAQTEFEARRRHSTTLDEDLFLHVITGLRRLEPFRPFVGQIFETAMSPFAGASGNEIAERIRVDHVETVAELISKYAPKPVLHPDPDILLTREVVDGAFAYLNDSTPRPTVDSSIGFREPTFVSMHLYWSLYLGVLAFWSKDESPKQEDTLVVLDQAMRLFVDSLRIEPKSREEFAHGA